MNSEAAKFSVVVPVYNEETAVASLLDKLGALLKNQPAEIIAVDDGSTDKSPVILDSYAAEGKIKLIRHSRNQGYGSALKSGIHAAGADKIVIIDADGSYPPETILPLLERSAQAEMVVAARKSGFKIEPVVRRFFKWMVLRLLHYLAGFEVPDLNSGLRVFSKNFATQYFSILPNGFSFTSTITLIHLSEGCRVEFVPVDYLAREGKSKFRMGELFSLSLLVLRTIMYFNPLRFFVPLSLIIVALALSIGFFSIFALHHFMDVTTSVLLVTSVQTFCLGLLADLLLRLRK